MHKGYPLCRKRLNVEERDDRDCSGLCGASQCGILRRSGIVSSGQVRHKCFTTYLLPKVQYKPCNVTCAGGVATSKVGSILTRSCRSARVLAIASDCDSPCSRWRWPCAPLHCDSACWLSTKRRSVTVWNTVCIVQNHFKVSFLIESKTGETELRKGISNGVATETSHHRHRTAINCPSLLV